MSTIEAFLSRRECSCISDKQSHATGVRGRGIQDSGFRIQEAWEGSDGHLFVGAATRPPSSLSASARLNLFFVFESVGDAHLNWLCLCKLGWRCIDVGKCLEEQPSMFLHVLRCCHCCHCCYRRCCWCGWMPWWNGPLTPPNVPPGVMSR